MGRILALDYGTKRIGIAVTDPLQIIANGLETVHSSLVVDYLKKYIAKEEVDCIVIGAPRNMDNTPSEVEQQIIPFIKHLSRTFPNIPIERQDERFTSKMAFQAMIDGGLKKKDRRKKELIDLTSATLILQAYLERKTHS